MEVSLRKNIAEGAPYISRRFQSAPPENLQLKIFISQNQFQWLIADAESTILYLHPFEMNDKDSSFLNAAIIKEIFESSEMLNKEFTSVSVGIFTPDFTLIPSEIRTDAAEDFFRTQLLNGEHSQQEIYHDLLEGLNISLMYPVGQETMQLIGSKFPSFKYQHSCSAQIRNLSARNQGVSLYAIIQNKWMQVICLSENQLLFANTFSFKTSEDFIYYVMSVYRVQGLNPEETPLVLFGEVLRDSALYQMALKYVRNVKLGKAADTWKFEDDYPFQLHFYSTLLSL